MRFQNKSLFIIVAGICTKCFRRALYFFELIALRLVMWSEGAGGGREFFFGGGSIFFCDEIVVSEEIKLKFSQIPPQPAPV